MSRKHFVAIAATIRTATIDHAAKLELAQSLASTLASTNTNFNRSRFIDACLQAKPSKR